MTWLVYRSFVCISMAFFISAIGRYLIFDTIPNIGITLYALSFALIFFFERLIISILIQNSKQK